MKLEFSVVVVLLLFSADAVGQSSGSSVTLTRAQVMMNAGEGSKTVTGEVAALAKFDKVSLGIFGFCDYRQDVPAQHLFCNVRTWGGAVRFPQVALASEQGWSEANGGFVSVGLQLNPLAVAAIKKRVHTVVRNISIVPLVRLDGAVARHQLLVVGRSQDFKLASWLEIYGEALYRMRDGSDYSWIEVRVRHPKHEWLSFGMHFEPFQGVVGVGPRAGR